VVFDLDGVIVDSEPTHERANVELAASLGVAYDPELAGAMMGRRVRDLTDELAARTGRTPEEVFADREAVFWRLLEERPLAAMPGLHPALARLATAGLPLALASSGTRRYVEHVLLGLGVRDHFTVVVSGEDVVHGKPDPEIYLRAAKALARDPAECAAIEDAPNGVAAARRAGMHVVVVPHELTSAMDFGDADAVVADLEAAAAHLLQG
jgi:HAD superfamily hydrolase (TIGR01509 family)